ncbi:hypothetical protein SRABI06_02440 [Pseudomonas brassicacearum]|nr:hypothetical protein SRABI06_02440 [Pseudomonas brassicacearum]
MARSLLWRGSLLPLGCEADPFPDLGISLTCIAVAAQPSGSKLPRHKSSQVLQKKALIFRPGPFSLHHYRSITTHWQP